MKNRMNVSRIVIAALIVVTTVAAVEQRRNMAEGLLDKSLHVREKTFDRMSDLRLHAVEDLVSVLERGATDESYDGTLHMCIQLLGEWRAEKATGVLLRHLMCLPKSDFIITGERLPTEAYYVSAMALRRIGQPSIRGLLRTIDRSDNKEERHLAAWVIMEIDGERQALYRLDNLIEEERNAECKARYEEARRFIANYKPVFLHPVLKEKYGTEENYWKSLPPVR